MPKKLKTREEFDSKIEELRSKESEMIAEKKALDKLVEDHAVCAQDEVEMVEKTIADSLDKQRELGQQMQKELEETYDDLNEVAKNGQPSRDYNNSGFVTYSKDWCCGDRSDSDKDENKIDKLEKFRDIVYGEITE